MSIFRCDSISWLGIWEGVREGVCVIKANNQCKAKYWINIECMLNVYWIHWIHIEMLQNMVQYSKKVFQESLAKGLAISDLESDLESFRNI